jgi:hypothetical protein
MISDPNFDVLPSAIYMSPLLSDLIDQEAKASKITLQTTEIVAGVSVTALSTQAGIIPLIMDPYILQDTTGQYGFSAPGSGNSNFFAVIVCEKMIERPVISGATHNPNPRLFQLGLLGNLSGQFVGLKFDHVVAKGPSYAHKVIAVVRPTV